MKNAAKVFVRDWLPPLILRWINKSGQVGFHGEYSTWENALARCSGYDSQEVFSKVLSSSLKVKRGEAAFERDSVSFEKVEYEWPLLAKLMWVAARSGGKLNVLDFGGALGSSYFQNRNFLRSLPDVMWSVVEQSHYVDAGCAYIQDENLRFYKSIEACIAENEPNVILLSSSLQYLESPDFIIDQLKMVGASFLIINRTPFSSQAKDKLVVQSVPESIYKASYPMWIISWPRLAQKLADEWVLVASDHGQGTGAETASGFKFSFEGMLLEALR